MDNQGKPHSLSSSALQPTTKTTILKSTAAVEARLELAQMNSFYSRRTGLSSKLTATVNDIYKKGVVSDHENINKASEIINGMMRDTSVPNSPTLDLVDDDDDIGSLNLSLPSYICNLSSLENLSVDDINASVIAHDGSEESYVPTFSETQLHNDLESTSTSVFPVIPKSNTCQAKTTAKSITSNNISTVAKPVPLAPVTVTSHNIASLPCIEISTQDHFEVPTQDGSQIENVEGKSREINDLDNSMEISFDASRGRGPICSSTLDLGSVLESETTKLCMNTENRQSFTKNNEQNKNTLISSLNLPLNNHGNGTVTAEQTASVNNALKQLKTSCVNSNKKDNNSVDLDLSEMARAKHGNPENVYGLLAGFIKTGKKSTNTITIHLNQCYNCDGTCVRNTISVSSKRKKTELLVVKDGIVNLESTNKSKADLIQSSGIATNEINKPSASAPSTTEQYLAASPSGFINDNGVSTILPSLQSPAPTFTPFDQARMERMGKKNKPKTKKSSKLSKKSPSNVSAKKSLPLEPLLGFEQQVVENLYQCSPSADNVDQNVTYVVNEANGLENENSQQRQSTGSLVIDLDYHETAAPILLTPEPETTQSSVSEISQIPNLKTTSSRKKGIKRPKKQLKLKTKQPKLVNDCVATVKDPELKKNVETQEYETSFRLKKLRIRKHDSSNYPALSPQAVSSHSRTPKPTCVKLLEIETKTAKMKKPIPAIVVREYLKLFTKSYDEDLERMVYSCKKCSFHTFGSVTCDRKLKSHFQKHIEPAQFKCRFCPKEFSAVSSTTKHELCCSKNPNVIRRIAAVHAFAKKNRTKNAILSNKN